MRSLPAASNRWLWITACFFGLSPHAGCGSGDSGSPEPGTGSPRTPLERFQNAKADAAKKLGKNNQPIKGLSSPPK
jgi:hypothetical protein